MHSLGRLFALCTACTIRPLARACRVRGLVNILQLPLCLHWQDEIIQVRAGGSRHARILAFWLPSKATSNGHAQSGSDTSPNKQKKVTPATETAEAGCGTAGSCAAARVGFVSIHVDPQAVEGKA